MKIIKLHYPFNQKEFVNTPIVLALGFFDGVHLGHQLVIKVAKEKANRKNVPLAVMSFNHHPSIVFSKNPQRQLLTPIDDKIEQFKNLGVDIFYIVSFTSQFANLSAEQFEHILFEQFHATTIVAGFDYRYGNKASGSIQQLQQKYSKDKDIEILPKFVDDSNNWKIGSTQIKDDLCRGHLERANRCLGRAYTTKGIVVRGHARGRKLGFPTANIQTYLDYILPKEAIYAIKIKVNNKWYNGMASIGRNITFGNNQPVTVEVNIFDFDEQIYGEEVVVAWHYYLRNEIKFNGIEQLIKQLKADETQSRRLLT